MSIYLELTREFNAGRLRAVIASGQAVMLHGLARFRLASTAWADAWPALEREVSSLPLSAAHARLVERAAALLPCEVRP